MEETVSSSSVQINLGFRCLSDKEDKLLDLGRVSSYTRDPIACCFNPPLQPTSQARTRAACTFNPTSRLHFWPLDSALRFCRLDSVNSRGSTWQLS